MRGTLSKMTSDLRETVEYALPVGEDSMPLNARLNSSIRFNFTGNIYCCACGRKTKKSFSQGYCFPCMRSLARCDMCVMKPETCHFAQGTCREPDWGQANCMIEHKVYLANTSGLKVGITRHTQIPTRWIDQGATQALPVFSVSTRHISGLLEITLGGFMADKTNWRTMLKGDAENLDLKSRMVEVRRQIGEQLDQIRWEYGDDSVKELEEEAIEIRYPVLQYPEKVKPLNFDKTPELEGVLLGIKGQYLILDKGVLNIRKFTSYEVEVE